MNLGIPDFLLGSGAEENRGPARQAKPGHHVRADFLDKGLRHIASVLRTTIIQWETSRENGFFQALDARVKVLFAVLLVIEISLRRSIPAMLGILAFCLLCASLSRVGMLMYSRRLALLALFFGFLPAVPSVLNVLVDGTIVYPLLKLHAAHAFWIYHVPQTIGITREGLLGTARLTLRVADSLAVSMLVLYTTPFHEIIRALKVLRVPDTFLMVITLAYKYIFIFAQTVEEMHLAKKSRLAGGEGGAAARRWVAGRLGLIFKKTQLRCEEIYKAMLARGFSGEIRLAGPPRMRRFDYACGAALCGAALAFLYI